MNTNHKSVMRSIHTSQEPRKFQLSQVTGGNTWFIKRSSIDRTML